MPRLAVEVSDTYDSITRPVVLAVSRKLVERLSLPTGTQVQYTGAADTAIQPGSALGDTPVPVQFPFTSKARISATEEYNEDQVLTTAVFKNEHNVIFADHALGVYLKPVYVGTQMTVSFRYRAPDRVSAERWRNELRRRASQGMGEQLHDFSYHYAIPKELQVILIEIFDRREAVAGYGETLETYFQEHFTDRLAGLTTLAGTEGVVAISEYQLGVLGWFNFPAVPDNPELAGDGGAWEVGFDYTFQFDKVLSVAMEYPILIHNQLLDERFRPQEGPYSLEQHRRDPSWSRHLLDNYTSLYRSHDVRVGGVVYPDFDDWLPLRAPLRTIPLFTSLMGVDETDPTLVVNFHDLGDFAISPNILAFMRTEGHHLLRHRSSVFLISLYRGDHPLPPEELTLSSDLELRTRAPMDLRDVHHVQLSLVIDGTILVPGAIDRLRRDPPACVEIIDAMDRASKTDSDPGGYHARPTVDPGLDGRFDGSLADDLVVIGGGKQVTRDSLEAALDLINKRNPNVRSQTSDSFTMTMRTVMQAGIVVHNSSPTYADYQTDTAARRTTAGATTDYIARAPRRDSEFESGTDFDTAAVRGRLTMADDLLSTGGGSGH